MKSYTDLEQSKKLAEILPIESADMYYSKHNTIHANTLYGSCDIQYFNIHGYIPCWSFATLLDVLPKSLIYTPNQALDGYCCKNIMHDLETYGDNPIDACYEMIIKLHE